MLVLPVFSLLSPFPVAVSLLFFPFLRRLEGWDVVGAAVMVASDMVNEVGVLLVVGRSTC